MKMNRPAMVFHTPYPLERDGRSASQIRPVKMRDAFEALGYEVIEISGYSGERRRRIHQLRARLRAGLRIQFAYSESSTMPTALTDPHHLPLRPFMDLSFLRFLREAGVPVGLFYRDIYWQFSEYANAVPAPIALGTRALYRCDLRRYRSAVDRLFLPSDEMAAYLPVELRDRAAALPPGADIVEASAPGQPSTLLFVGGVGEYYRLHECMTGVAAARDARLILCTRREQWKAVSSEYAALLGSTTEVVHRAGEELETLYQRAHFGSLFLEPMKYREFAAPLKMYEYLGHGKPIICVRGSLAAKFVSDNGVGWVLDYDAAQLASLLDRLRESSDEVARVTARVKEVREHHTWIARARHAVALLDEAR